LDFMSPETQRIGWDLIWGGSAAERCRCIRERAAL
jgi:hypothetical protein